ncbi:MAG: YicC family protein [Syntrophobacterales bacterium]|nr:MAG: YicC family protein [Syntrophobacterales bacterium]
MIKSMTGYGRAETELEGRNVVIEIKSLNHRNLEVHVRLPAFLGFLEMDIKKRIQEKISRGRVEIGMKVDAEPGANGGEKLSVNLPLIREYHALLKNIKEELGLQDEITLNLIARLKNGIYVSDLEIDPDEAWKTIHGALDEAVDSLLKMKEKEGELLYSDFVERLALTKGYIQKLEARAPVVALEYKDRLRERIGELAQGVEIDESRLSQEIAILAEKSDITEETVRLTSHMVQFREMIQEGGATGRKLDFLLQEMHREINTIGSKSNDLEISSNVIEIKTELAKLREQVQNIE